MERGRAPETDSGWVGAGPDDDLDERLAAELAAFDRGAPHMMTALGPIDPAALGVTLCGEHLTWPADESDDAAIDGRYATLAELDDAYAAGVRTLIDLGDPTGRVDLPTLRWLAERAPTHLIVPATATWSAGSDAMADRLAADIVHGIAGTAIRAGTLLLRLHVAASREQVIAAAAAQRRTGALLLLKTEGGEPAAAVARLADAGVALERMMLVASVRRWEEKALQSVLERGAGVLVADLLADGWVAAADHAAVVASLVDFGFGDRMVLGSGLTRRAGPRPSGGEPGWSGMVERFPLLLMEAGLGAVAVRALLVDNPRRALTIEPPAGNEGTA